MKMKSGRVCSIGTIARHQYAPSASLHCYTASMLLCAILLASAATSTCAFGSHPSAMSRRSEKSFPGFKYKYVGCDETRYDHSSRIIYALADETLDDSNDMKPVGDEDENEENDDDEEDDIITQRLRRNSEAGPINPMKEHDKMVKENEDEANCNTTDVSINSSDASSTLYSHMVATTIDPDFDPNASFDESYVESQFKELLSRKGEVLSRLGPGIATLPLDPNSSEGKSEEVLAKKELALQQVIAEVKASGEEKWDEYNLDESRNKQSNILERANKLQQEIDQLHVDDCGAVLLANLGFYEAFSLQDSEGMRSVWWHSPSVMCIHPSHPPLIGSNAVFESFTTIFNNGMNGAGRRQGSGISASGGVFMTPTNIRGLSVRGNTASLVCDEEVFSKGSAGETTSQQGGLMVNKLISTNIFRKIGGVWKMTHRHASWHPETTAAQAAVKAEPGLVLYDDEQNNANRSDGEKKSRGMALRRLNGDGISKRPKGSTSIPSSLQDLDAKSVLGIPMPKKEEPKKSKGSIDGADGIISKIISLNDLLGGNDDDDDEDEEKGLGDVLADMLSGSADSDKTQTTGSGTADDPFITRRIIKIGPEGLQNLVGKKNKKDVDDDDDQNMIIDLRGKSKDERKEVLSQLLDNTTKDEHLKSSALDAVVSRTTPINERESIRQNCIATLRNLSDKGLLSSKQKRVLLTDIITSSARGETSMVEVAFELLCSGQGADGDEDLEHDTGMEDFTEQCRVFASTEGEDR
jgi:hypothetical protein